MYRVVHNDTYTLNSQHLFADDNVFRQHAISKSASMKAICHGLIGTFHKCEPAKLDFQMPSYQVKNGTFASVLHNQTQPAVPLVHSHTSHGSSMPEIAHCTKTYTNIHHNNSSNTALLDKTS